jgi:ElaB/YqjD/DUF883 family membrane-anchored ribosome-binding protein
MQLSQETRERLASEFEAICRHARGLLEAAGGEIDARGGEVIDRLQQGLKSAKDGCRRMEAGLQEGVTEAQRLVREKPIQTLAVAAAAGLLLGWLLSGRKRS